MVRVLALAYSTMWRAALALVTVSIAVVSVLRYFTSLIPAPPPIIENAFASPFLVLHVFGGVVALLLGPLQLTSAVRTRWPAFHRSTGRLYIAACAIGAPSGLILALGTTAGPVAGAGFVILALLWPLFTWLGVRAAMERRFDQHRAWMLRSYAMTAAAITLRLMLPAAGMLGFGFYEAYSVIAWISWITNLLLVEFIIRRKAPSARRVPQLATA